MVFEQVIKVKWIKNKEHAFLLAAIYAILGIISARIIFPRSTGLMSVAFTAVLLVPSLNILMSQEENEEVREKKLSLIALWRDHSDVLKVYLFLFLGIFTVYSITSLLMDPSVSYRWFEPQFRAAGVTGAAIDFFGETLSIIKNNLLIFVVCFALSLAYGAGAVIFLTWNASVWGTVFGFFVTKSTSVAGNTFLTFVAQIGPFLPHMVSEAIAYIMASIVGGIMSKAIIREEIGSQRFNHILTDALIVLAIGALVVVLAAFIEVYFFAQYFVKQ